MLANDDDDELAMFTPGGGSCPVQYDAVHDGVEYLVHYRHGWLTISVDACERDVFEQRLSDDDDDGYWSDAETNVYLRLIARAFAAGGLGSLVLPTKREVTSHPLHEPGPLPRYHLPLCTQTHAHTNSCYSEWTISARELAAKNATGR